MPHPDARSTDRIPSFPEQDHPANGGSRSERHRYRYGVDTVAVGFLLDRFDDRFDGWRHNSISSWSGRRDGQERTTDTWRCRVSGVHGPKSRVHVGVMLSETGVLRCRLEFNAGKAAAAELDELNGVTLLPVRSLPAVLRKVIMKDLPDLGLVPSFLVQESKTVAGSYQALALPDPDSHVTIHRLDIALDFTGVDNIGAYLQVLRQTRQPYAKQDPSVHYNRATGRLQSVLVGNSSGRVRAYDKHVQSAGAAPPGTLRVEVQFNGPWLRKFEIDKLDRVSDARVEQAFRDRFPWSGLDQHIAGMSILLQRIADLHEAKSTRLALPTYLLARWHGVDFGFSNGMIRKLERLAREIGRPSADPAMPDSMPPHRLDLELGTEVPVGAGAARSARSDLPEFDG